MKKVSTIIFAAFVAIGCNNAAQPPNQATTTNAYTNMNANSTVKANDSGIVSSHSTDVPKTGAPPSNRPAGSTESPMARPIDVKELTADIEKAEAAFKKDPKAKADLAKAYFVRATALTDAAQYRAALGDYRKGLKLNPNDPDAKKMHDQIITIFQQIGREPPKEGEEPNPLPMN